MPLYVGVKVNIEPDDKGLTVGPFTDPETRGRWAADEFHSICRNLGNELGVTQIKGSAELIQTDHCLEGAIAPEQFRQTLRRLYFDVYALL